MYKTGSHAVMEGLVKENVSVIFGYPGGAIMPLYDALYDYHEKIHHVLVRHEQGAAHAAVGYSRISGQVGVCFATSGPGATNLVTGIADAMADSVPLVCITGQVTSSVLGTDAFQEVDVMGITTPITKWNYQVTNSDEIPEIIMKAFQIAKTGRPGPVVIDITKDAQLSACQSSFLNEIKYHQKTLPPLSAEQIKLAADLLNTAKRPYVLIGHGVLLSRAEEELKLLIEKGGFPVASTLLGLTALPNSHPQFVGLLGMHGNYGANLLANQADVILAVGLRFSDRVTGRLNNYLPNAKIIQIDIDSSEVHKNVHISLPIIADAKKALSELSDCIKPNNHSQWLARFRSCDAIEEERIIRKQTRPTEGKLKMAEVIHTLSEKTKGSAIIVSDVGQNQMITARYYKFTKPNSWVSSGGMGVMGFSLPAAIGAKFAAPEREVISINGDGGFQMNIQELATIAQEKIPVKIIILNNGYLGMVRQWQELFFDKRYSMVSLANPDFIQVAKGFYIKGERVTERSELSASMDRMLNAEDAYVLDIVVEQEDNIFPMIYSGASVEEIKLERN